jgi:hypothetical protein
VKGGKYVFGWSRVGEDGRIIVPEEALQEYHIDTGERVILMSGSTTSGGFSIARKSLLAQSSLSNILARFQDVVEFQTGEGELVNVGNRRLCWTIIGENGQLLLLPDTLMGFGIRPGDYLLVLRGSYLGIGMAVKGPLIKEAGKHPDIPVFRS